MPRIIAIEPVVPEHVIEQSAAADSVRALFAGSFKDVDRLLPIFANTEIDRRYFCMPPEWFKHNHAFAEKNKLYFTYALQLCEKAIRQLLARVELAPEKIDHIFFISTTGVATPSLDAHLLNRLHLAPNIRRTPIWGLGCAGGVAGIARATDWLKAYPEKIALVVAVELCSLTFIRDDISKSNFVATSLFGDGAAAVLLAGDQCKLRQRRMLGVTASDSITWQDSLDVMGWEINHDGLKVLFSRDIPTIVQQSARPAVLQFLAQQSVALADITACVSHPGGAKVIRAYEAALELAPAQTRHMWNVLRQFGNMSSVTVLFVLHEFLQSPDFQTGAITFSSTLGPGFTSEMFLGACL